MSEGIPFGDIIVFAAIAAFILLRYRSILGDKTGFDPSKQPKPKIEKSEKKTEERVIDIKPRKTPEPEKPVIDAVYEDLGDGDVKSGIDDIKKADGSFRVDEFLKGAKMAFEMVLSAFHSKDDATLKMLLDKPIYEEFSSAMKDGEGDAAVTLVSIKEAELIEAEMQGSKAQVTVQFVSEQIIAPNTTIEEVEDEWVFERDTRSKNPNWTIIDT